MSWQQQRRENDAQQVKYAIALFVLFLGVMGAISVGAMIYG